MLALEEITALHRRLLKGMLIPLAGEALGRPSIDSA